MPRHTHTSRLTGPITGDVQHVFLLESAAETIEGTQRRRPRDFAAGVF